MTEATVFHTTDRGRRRTSTQSGNKFEGKSFIREYRNGYYSFLEILIHQSATNPKVLLRTSFHRRASLVCHLIYAVNNIVLQIKGFDVFSKSIWFNSIFLDSLNSSISNTLITNEVQKIKCGKIETFLLSISIIFLIIQCKIGTFNAGWFASTLGTNGSWLLFIKLFLFFSFQKFLFYRTWFTKKFQIYDSQYKKNFK